LILEFKLQLVGKRKSVFSKSEMTAAERHRKLASHKVAGAIAPNRSCPEGTKEGDYEFPPSLQDGFFWDDEAGTLCRANFQRRFATRFRVPIE